MQEHLGRTFFTIIRSIDDLQALLALDPFAQYRLPPASKRIVTFLRQAPAKAPARLPDQDGARILHNDISDAPYDGVAIGWGWGYNDAGGNPNYDENQKGYLHNTRYATPNDKLGIRRVRDRLYRGYCFPDSNFTKAIALFNAKKDAIYALYHDKIGQLLKPDIVKETTEYIDDFYKTINNPRDAKRQLMEACFGRK